MSLITFLSSFFRSPRQRKAEAGMSAALASASRGLASFEKARRLHAKLASMPAGIEKLQALDAAIAWAMDCEEPILIRNQKSATLFSGDEDIVSIWLFDRAYETSDLCGDDLSRINMTLMDLNLSLYLALTPEMAGFVSCLRYYFITNYIQGLAPYLANESTIASRLLGPLNPDFRQWVGFAKPTHDAASFNYYIAAPHAMHIQGYEASVKSYLAVPVAPFKGTIESLSEPFGQLEQLMRGIEAVRVLDDLRTRYPRCIKRARV